MAENIEIGKAFITVVPSLEGSQATITKELTGVTNKAADKAGEESGGKFGEKFAGALKGAGAAIGAAMATAAGAAVATGKAFIDSANDVAAYGDQVDKMSQKMGISAEAYQEWDFVMQHAGASIDSLKASMKTLATAAETDSEAFAALGISQEQIASMSQEDLFGATISALQNVSDETERTYLAGQLLGRGATELGALFNMSSEETEALKQQVHDLGGVMSDEAVKDAAAYKDAMQNMETSLDGLKNNMMSQFLPGITSVMNGLAGVFSGNGGMEEIQSGLESVIGKITELAPRFFSLAETLILSLISGFGPMLPQLTNSIFSVLIQGITTVTSMLPSMMPSILAGIQGILTALLEAAPIITSGLTELIVMLVTWLSSGDTLTSFVNGLIDLCTQIADSIAMVLPVLLPAVVRIISEIALALTSPENVEQLLNSVLLIIGSIVVAIWNALPEIWNLIVGLFTNIVELGANFIDNASTALANWLGNIIPKIGTFFSNIGTKIKTWFTETVQKAAQFGLDILNKFKELPSKLIEVGSNLIKGLWEGIQNMTSWIAEKIQGFGESVVNGLKSFFGIASPSKLMENVIGKNLALGIAEGFDDEIDNVEADMVKDMNDLTGNMSATVTAYGAQASGMIDESTTFNGGNITLNVYGAEGQNVNELAEVIAVKLENMTRRKKVIYG